MALTAARVRPPAISDVDWTKLSFAEFREATHSDLFVGLRTFHRKAQEGAQRCGDGFGGGGVFCCFPRPKAAQSSSKILNSELWTSMWPL
jgi:hypothetical protein